MMKITPLEIPQVLLVEPKVFNDDRGYFFETFRASSYHEHGIGPQFVQDNESFSTRGVLRGLHYQLNYPQGKLVRVTQGEVFDVAVDIRRGSPTFGKWAAAHLSADNKHQLWVPPGFAHGFCVISETAQFLYKCTEYYHSEDELAILWNDPDLNINWPLQHATVSNKDSLACLLKDANLPVYKA